MYNEKRPVKDLFVQVCVRGGGLGGGGGGGGGHRVADAKKWK